MIFAARHPATDIREAPVEGGRNGPCLRAPLICPSEQVQADRYLHVYGIRTECSTRSNEGSGSLEPVKLLSSSPRHLGSALGPRKAQSMVRGPGERVILRKSRWRSLGHIFGGRSLVRLGKTRS